MRSFGVVATLALLSSSALAQPAKEDRNVVLLARQAASNQSSTTSVAATTSSTSQSSAAGTTSAGATSRAPSSAAAAPKTVYMTQTSTVTVTQAAVTLPQVTETVTQTQTAFQAARTITVTAPATTFTSTVTQASQTIVSTKTLYVPSTTYSPLPLPTPVNFTDYTYQNNALATSNVSSFLGLNTGAIASWFRTNNSQDSTNGHSWCSFPYNDTLPGFAPSVKTMLANFGGDYKAAGEAYCGLEAVFTTPSGRNATLYVIDGFADPWVLTPTSIDVITGVYPLLYGSETQVKDDVVTGVQWEFTGRRAEQFKFGGVGSG